MTERKEPTISTSNAPLEREDPQRARAHNTTAAQQATRPASGSRPPPVSSRPVASRSPLAPLALVVALLAAGFSGYLFWQLQHTQQSLLSSSQALARSDARITELESRLMLSDDESTQSLTVLQANVKENASEIRKLWGVAYDRNRTAISKLEESVDKLQKSMAGVDGKIKSALGEVAGEVRVLSELVDAQQAVINRVDKNVKEQASAIKAAVQKLDSLDAISKQVQMHDEAIKAIDAFRLQVNRELINLKGG